VYSNYTEYCLAESGCFRVIFLQNAVRVALMSYCSYSNGVLIDSELMQLCDLRFVFVDVLAVLFL